MANRSKAIGTGARSAQFKLASAYYWGAQYDELPTHYDKDSQELTLRERQPGVNLRVNKKVVDTVNKYLFGADKLPNFRVSKLPDGDNNEREPETPADQAQLDLVNGEIAKIRRWSQLNKYMSEIGRLGLTQGTIALAGHVFEGNVWAEVLEVADAQPIFGRDDRKVAIENGLQEDDLLSLVEYWAEEIEAEEADGEPTYKIHKRQWDLESTIEFVPVDVDTLEGVIVADLEWVEDSERSVKHGLGFVPVVWIRNRIVANSAWGAPLVGAAEQALEDEINYTMTQAGRGVRYSSEPTPILKDVVNLAFDDKIRRGGDQSIQITSATNGPEAAVTLLEMSGAGQAAASAYVAELAKRFDQAVGVVEHDPEKALGALSGTALERLMGPLIATVADLREVYGAGLARWFELMLRTQGIEGYTVEAHWPRVVEPTLDELSAVSNALLALYNGGLMLREDAIQILSHWTGADDVGAYIERLDAETASGGSSFVGNGAAPADPASADNTLP